MKHEATIIARFAKKVAITAIALCFMVSASAQQGEKSVGGHLSYYSESDLSMIGIGAKFRYNITDPIRLEGAFTFFLPKTESFFGVKLKYHIWDFSANGHYVFNISDKFALYPLAGLSVLGIKATGSGFGESYTESQTKLFLNIGGGFDFKVADNIAITVEPKIMIGDSDGSLFMLSAGVVFAF